jgi:o-succinylbenzoate---CoA ligase
MVSTCPIRARALETPGALALVASGRRLTFAELDLEVAAWAARLRRHGVSPGDRVALLAWNGLPAAALLFAVRRLRATLVPLNARLTRAELLPLAQRLEPRLVLAEESLGERLPEARALESLESEACGLHADTACLAPAEDWALLFTSGTTGQPKAARLPVGGLLASAAASRRNLGASPEDRWLCTLPLFHVGGLAMAVRCAVDGSALVLHRRFEAEAVARELATGGITHTSLVARTLAQSLDAGAKGPDLRAVLVGGGPVPESLVARARAAGLPILRTYGLTEACSQVATERPGEADGTSCGPPLPTLEVRIEATGEILVRGPTLMAGYHGDAAVSAAALAGGWLHTGDVGALDGRGRLRVLARRSDLIISGGENVYPAEVEAVLASHPSVVEAAVVGREDAAWGEVPVAAVVLRPGTGPEGLLTWARGRLAAFKVPADLVVLPALPRTALEKVDRAALRHEFSVERRAGTSQMAKGVL